MKPSKKKRGFRAIAVDGVNYTWRGGGVVTVMLANGPSNSSQLTVEYGFFDVWLYMNESAENRPPAFDLHSETPGFVAKAIRFAREAGWSPETDRTSRMLKYRDQQFVGPLE